MSDFKQLGPIVKQMQRRIWKSSPALSWQSLWQEAVGRDIASHTEVKYVRDGKLVVGCASSGWVCELKLVAGEIVEKINKMQPSEAIKEVHFVHQASAGGRR